MKWICDDCQAIHHYLPGVCQRCGATRRQPGDNPANSRCEEKEINETKFEDFMEELEDGKE